jgi:hypothetical protein
MDTIQRLFAFCEHYTPIFSALPIDPETKQRVPYEDPHKPPAVVTLDAKIEGWDLEFCTVPSLDILCSMLHIADFLNVGTMKTLCSKAIALLYVRGKTPEEMHASFDGLELPGPIYTQ